MNDHKEPESKKYQEMLTEVETIVQRLSNNQLDLDDMVTQIEHGYGLIQNMRTRLNQTKATVEKLKSQFEKDDASSH